MSLKYTLKKEKKQHRKKKMNNTRTPPQTGVKPMRPRRASRYCLPQDTRHAAHIFNMCWTPRYTNIHTQ